MTPAYTSPTPICITTPRGYNLSMTVLALKAPTMKPNRLRQFVYPLIAFLIVSSILQNSINPPTDTNSDSRTKSDAIIEEQKLNSDSTNEGSGHGEAHESSGNVSDSPTSSQSETVEQQPASEVSQPADNLGASKNDKPELPSQQTSSADELVQQVISQCNPQVPNSLNETFAVLQNYPKPAQGDLDKAEKLNKLGLAELKTKNYEEAAQLFSDASLADPSDAKLASNLGFAEMHTGRLDSAEQHLYSSLVLDPSRQVAWWDLGMTFAKKGEPSKARTCLLIGQKCSGDQSLAFLRSLLSDADSSVRDAAASAIQSSPTAESHDPFTPATGGE